MSALRFRKLALIFACLAFLANGAVNAGDELKVGAAAVKITPPNGTPMAGYYGFRASDGVLDDIHAKATVFDDGRTKVALVVCDLIGLPPPVTAAAKRLAQEKTGIPADNIMLSATHTHTGPVILGTSKDREELFTGGSKLSVEYTEQLPKWIAQAVEQALAAIAPARVSYGSEIEQKLAYVRRFNMKDGTVAWNPGIGNPKIVRPIGVVDTQVNVVYAETLGKAGDSAEKMAADGSRRVLADDKKPLLTYVNFALHLDTTGGTKISADYPATLAARLADYKGPEMLTIFANGPCGNINHLNVNWPARQTSPAIAKRIGTILAADALKAYADLKKVEDTTIRVKRETVELPLAKFTEDDLREARETVANVKSGMKLVKAYKVLDVAARNGKPYEAAVQVITLGRDIAWVALPGEVFVELGFDIKAKSPFRQTNVVELADGPVFYIPNRSAYPEGQYEVVTTRYAEGAGEILTAAANRILDELSKQQ